MFLLLRAVKDFTMMEHVSHSVHNSQYMITPTLDGWKILIESMHMVNCVLRNVHVSNISFVVSKMSSAVSNMSSAVSKMPSAVSNMSSAVSICLLQ